MIASLKLRQRLIYFLGIGGTAALTHTLIVLILVTYLQLPPLTANIIAFLCAFNQFPRPQVPDLLKSS